MCLINFLCNVCRAMVSKNIIADLNKGEKLDRKNYDI